MKYILLVSIILFLSALNLTLAAECHGEPGPEKPNENAIWDSTPTLLKTVKNGKLYQIGDPATNTTMYLTHVWGSMYEKGYAQGELLKEELTTFLNEIWEYISTQVVDALPKWIPSWLSDDIANLAAGGALDLTYALTKKYTTREYFDEIRGLSDASGVDYKMIRRIHMIGELTKGACSMFGAWGNATKGGNQTIQLRALDWDMDGPFKKFPGVTIYHADGENSKENTWANIGFIGWLGTLSGINEYHLGVSEIGVSYPDASFGKESRIGNPFTYVLRDILQFDRSYTDSVERLTNEHRTCNLLFGVGDGLNGQFRGFQLSHDVCNVYDDTNLAPANDTWHPKIQNTVYWGMDWLCPTYTSRLSDLLTRYHGEIDALTSVQQIVPRLTSGDLQAVLYDLTALEVYISYGYKSDDGSVRLNAYERPFTKLDMKKVFNETRPDNSQY